MPDAAKLGKGGGPWQSLEHGSAYYLYWFAETDELFVFTTSVLVDYLEANLASFRPCPVRNKGYTTLGYIVPKAALLKFHEDNPDKKLLVPLDTILFFQYGAAKQ